MFASRYMPCSDCGASVDQRADEAHVCDAERRLDYRLFQLRAEVAAFDNDLGEFLASPRGRFELWYVARERARRRNSRSA